MSSILRYIVLQKKRPNYPILPYPLSLSLSHRRGDVMHIAYMPHTLCLREMSSRPLSHDPMQAIMHRDVGESVYCLVQWGWETAIWDGAGSTGVGESGTLGAAETPAGYQPCSRERLMDGGG